MNKYNKYRYFLAPDKGGSTGGTTTSDPSKAGGNTVDPNDPFAGIDLDNLDDGSRAVLEGVQKQFATLQIEKQRTEEQMRQFQSRADQSAAELNRIKSSIVGQAPVVDPQQNAIAEVEKIMIDSGVNPTAAKGQAPIMAQLLSKQREEILKEVGKGVAPVAGLVMNHQAEQAFNYARATDSSGALSIPEVAQAVWNSCQEIAREGTPITAETVKNLKGMHFMAHAEKNPGVFATLQMNPGVPSLNNPPAGSRVPVSITTGGFNYPGSTFHPSVSAPADPNAARTSLDAGTKAALQSVFSVMKPGHQVQ